MSNQEVVLDLDDTLIHAFQITQLKLDEIETNPEYSYLKDRMKILRIVDINDEDVAGKGEISIFMIVLRPYLKEFLDFILKYFDKVSIWSAGHKRYVRAIESIIFSPDDEVYNSKCTRVLTRRDCNEITSKSVLKDLSSKGYDLKKTLFIDDNLTTSKNNRDNAIHLPAYDVHLRKDHIMFDDRTLQQIIEWIKNNNINKCDDIRTIDKSNIFPKRQSSKSPTNVPSGI